MPALTCTPQECLGGLSHRAISCLVFYFESEEMLVAVCLSNLPDVMDCLIANSCLAA